MVLALVFDLVIVADLAMAHALAAGGGERMNDVLSWLTDGINWSGADGIPIRVLEHLKYSLLSLGIAALIAVPVGLWVGHTGRGKFAGGQPHRRSARGARASGCCSSRSWCSGRGCPDR